MGLGGCKTESQLEDRSRQRSGMRRWGRRNSALYGHWARLLAMLGYRRMIRRAVASLPQEGVLADIGCGTGEALSILARQRPGLRCIALDLSPEMVRRAARIPTALPVAGDSEAIPLRSGGCAAVICFGVLGHLLDARLAVAESARILSPDGTLILWTRTGGFLSRLVAAGFERTNPGVRFLLHPAERIERHIIDAGLRVLEERRAAGGVLWRCERTPSPSPGLNPSGEE